MTKAKPGRVRIRWLKKPLKILQKPGHEEYRGQRTSLYSRSRDLLEVVAAAAVAYLATSVMDREFR